MIEHGQSQLAVLRVKKVKSYTYRNQLLNKLINYRSQGGNRLAYRELRLVKNTVYNS